ncbi:DUF2147 domain-containing protein [Spirosoma daeguense]
MNSFRLGALLLVLCMTLPALAPKNDDPDAVLGRWLSSKKRNQVQIYKQGDKYFGKLVWMLEPTDPATKKLKVDSENPDQNLRSRPLMQMVLVSNLKYKGNNVWGDGEVYNPEDGKTYGCELSLKNPNELDMRGYVMGVTMFGKTKTWTRVK